MDGFGAAWSAWKKFGDTAEYIPASYPDTPPVNIEGKEVYIVDFSYDKETLLDIERRAKRLVILDHHIGSKDAVTSVKEHVFGESKSGAYLAWEFFHPDTKVPRLIAYISDSDTWTHALPFREDVGAYIYRESENKLSFSYFNTLSLELDSEDGFEYAKKVGAILREAHMAKVQKYAEKAELVTFEGYDVYAVFSPSEIRSELGHLLAEKTNSFSLLFWYEQCIWKCSLRSVKDFDVVPIAKKYNGGGHKNAAAFTVPTDFPLPFVTKLMQGQ